MSNGQQDNIICPNEQLYDGNDYRWSSKKIAQAWNSAYQRVGRELSEIEGGRILLVIGLPSSGKSTYLRMSEDTSDYDLVFDGGFITRISRAALVNLCKGAGWEVDAVLVDTPINVAGARNKKNYNRQRVPPSLFSRLAETLEPPTEIEGFSKVSTVSMNRPWSEIKDFVKQRDDSVPELT
tara:strand:+ start:192 stop:734 length:543 start_codon:yes stop_codon:yes gene_type:complete